MRLRSDVTWRRGAGEPGFLFARTSGGIFGLNRASALIVESLLEGCSVEDLVRRVADRFLVFELTARQDVLSLLDQMKRFDLVEE
ncbi:MAG: PqqD family protein [Planctomycetes bacterium]|nr:PqqD family protein [Planctomycetota bacterium]